MCCCWCCFRCYATYTWTLNSEHETSLCICPFRNIQYEARINTYIQYTVTCELGVKGESKQKLHCYCIWIWIWTWTFKYFIANRLLCLYRVWMIFFNMIRLSAVVCLPIHITRFSLRLSKNVVMVNSADSIGSWKSLYRQLSLFYWPPC